MTIKELYETIKQKRDNAEQVSETEFAKGMNDYNYDVCNAYDNQVIAYDEVLSLIENSGLLNREEKVLKIAKKAFAVYFKTYRDVDTFNHFCVPDKNRLAEKEYDLLKEMFGDE